MNISRTTSMDEIISDLVIYRAIEILKGNVKVKYNKEDERILGEYYEMGISNDFNNSINNDRNDVKRFYKRKRGKWIRYEILFNKK